MIELDKKIKDLKEFIKQKTDQGTANYLGKEIREICGMVETEQCNIDLVSGCFSFAKYFKENYKFWRYTKDNKETYQSEISGKIMTEEEIFEHWKSNNR